jgi:tetratricopeptide (TPR) repeat protein
MLKTNLPECAKILFETGDLPLRTVRGLRQIIDQNTHAHRELLEKHKAGIDVDAKHKSAIAYIVNCLGDIDESQSKDPFFLSLMGMANVQLEDFATAETQLKKAADKYNPAKTELSRLYLQQEKLNEANELIPQIENQIDNALLGGRLAELEHRTEQAIDLYERVLELNSEELEAAFKLGVLLDRIGDDDMAIEHYQVCADTQPHFVPGVMNLGILYDERGESAAAVACFRQTLAYNPLDRRALRLLKDAKLSKNMYYDEKEEREREKMDKLFRTSINDFELSVRSRNCLAKMNIFTLGDLVSITEAEMLNYKNFGETSLKEIKLVLEARNLRLGMLREREDRTFVRADPKTSAESIEKLELSSRTTQVLERLDIAKIGDLLRFDDLTLYRAPGSGQSVVQEISTALGAFGLMIHTPEIRI